jgi:hypothetical protein
MSMAYDATRAEVVMFGGFDGSMYNDTWTWDGTTWTEEHPGTKPAGRAYQGMTYDATRGNVVLFGGWDLNNSNVFGDTWTWNGTTWRIPFKAHLDLTPGSGPPGTVVQWTGTGFAAFEQVTITFIDSVNGETVLATAETDALGDFTSQRPTAARAIWIPLNATPGMQKVTAVGAVSHQKAKATFTVT